LHLRSCGVVQQPLFVVPSLPSSVAAPKDHDRPLRIGVLTAESRPLSVKRYLESVTRHLGDDAAELLPVENSQSFHNGVDLLWDPACLGGKAPPLDWEHAPCPVVATLHGVAPFSLPWREVHETMMSAVRGATVRALHRTRWRRWRGRVHVITVSEFARDDIVRHLSIPRSTITPIHHGVDHRAFHEESSPSGSASPNRGSCSDGGSCSNAARPFLLHVSQYQRVKNVARILQAYRMLEPVSFDLHIQAPGLPQSVQASKGVRVSRRTLSTDELAVLYRQASGFVFPSLQESFGLPILEAMSAGCPVITSNTTACAEIAGDAAVRVDPRSVGSIADAMKNIMTDAALRSDLRQRGRRRSRKFRWEESAAEHLRLFRSVVN